MDSGETAYLQYFTSEFIVKIMIVWKSTTENLPGYVHKTL